MNKTIHLLSISLILLLASCSVQNKCGYITVTNGDKIYYEEKGKGEPLLLLHGHSLDMRMWDKQLKSFSNHYRTIMVDFRGYGKSSGQTGGFQFTHADDLITVMDSLKIPKAYIVGLSMGGFIAGDILAMYPQRVMKCVLASGSIRRGSMGPGEPMDHREHELRDKEINALKAKGVDRMKAEWIETLVSGGGSERESIRKPLEDMIYEWSAWQPLNKESRLYYAKDAWQRLTSRPIHVPVLMLHGEKENKKAPQKEGLYMKSFHHIILPDCGHMMNMEQPELFNTTVLRFFKEGAAPTTE